MHRGEDTRIMWLCTMLCSRRRDKQVVLLVLELEHRVLLKVSGKSSRVLMLSICAARLDDNTIQARHRQAMGCARVNTCGAREMAWWLKN